MSKELIQQTKQAMKDLKYGDPIPNNNIDTMFQVKYDGWFSHITIKDGFATVVTSGGEVRKRFDIDVPDAIVLAEWMYGTNSSQTHPLKDKFIIHDVLSLNGYNLKNDMYIARISSAVQLTSNPHDYPNFPFVLIPSHFPEQFEDIWKTEVLGAGEEGVVFKHAYAKFGEDTMYRMKREFTMDYIVVGFKEGAKRLEGTLGALEGGLYYKGNLMRILSVGGGFTDSEREEIWENKPKYLGMVFEASGKALFESGALRHPAFQRFRTDKIPQECILS